MAEKLRIVIDVDGNQAVATLKKVSKSTDEVGKSSKKSSKAISGMTKALGGLAVGSAAVSGLSKLVDVSRQFSVISASLKTVTGSAKEASKAFKNIEEFAATTPFSLNQVADAFIKMKALGLDPSNAALTAYGNTAAAMGKDLNQMIEAVADASTFEFERLKEFGIKASQQGDQVSFTFRGITTTVGKNAAEIEGFLKGIGDNDFAGAMKERANSLDGALSNLSDSWDGLFRAIGSAGASDAITEVTRAFAGLTEAAKQFFDKMNEGTDIGNFEALKSVNDEIDRLSKSIEQRNGQHLKPFEFLGIADDPIPQWKAEVEVLKARREELRKNATRTQSMVDVGKGLVDIGMKPKGGKGKNPFVEDNSDTGLIASAQRDADRIQQIQEFYAEQDRIAQEAVMTDIERENSDFTRRQDQLEIDMEFLREKGFTEEEIKAERRQFELSAEIEHKSRLQDINDKNEKARIQGLSNEMKFAESIRAGDLKGALDSGTKMLAILGKHSKQAFEAHKAVATAKAIVAGYESAVTAFAWGTSVGGPVVGVIAAAASIAYTASQISAIQSQTFGGGASLSSGGSAPSGISTPAPAQASPPPIDDSKDKESSLNITINAPEGLVDPIVAQQLADSLAPHIKEAFRNGIGEVTI